MIHASIFELAPPGVRAGDPFTHTFLSGSSHPLPHPAPPLTLSLHLPLSSPAALQDLCESNGINEDQLITKGGSITTVEMFLFNFPKVRNQGGGVPSLSSRSLNLLRLFQLISSSGPEEENPCCAFLC
jgi:hypothetical protein